MMSSLDQVEEVESYSGDIIQFNDPKEAMFKYANSATKDEKRKSDPYTVDAGFVIYTTRDFEKNSYFPDDKPHPRILDIDISSLPQEKPKKLSNWKQQAGVLHGVPVIKDLSLKVELQHQSRPTTKIGNLYSVKKELVINAYDDIGMRSDKKRVNESGYESPPRKRLRIDQYTF